MQPLVAALEHDPRRILRIVGAGALLVGAAVGITLAAAPWKGKGDPCGGGAARMAGVWHAGRRAEIEGAFNRTKLPYAGASFATTAAALDRYAAAWIAGHRDSCEATHVRRDQSPVTLDLRTRCLEQRRAAMAATVAILAAGEPNTVQLASRVIDSLPFGSMEADLGPWQAALDHAERSYAIMVELGLGETPKGANRLRGQAKPLMHLGRIDEALERNARALALIEAVAVEGDDSLGGFLLDRGEILEIARRYDEARAMYQKAFDIYVKTRGADHPHTTTLRIALIRIGLLGRLAAIK